jgi:hypothetical protein
LQEKTVANYFQISFSMRAGWLLLFYYSKIIIKLSCLNTTLGVFKGSNQWEIEKMNFKFEDEYKTIALSVMNIQEVIEEYINPQAKPEFILSMSPRNGWLII